MTTLTWDALGGDPAPGETGAYDELARSFSETASNAGAAHGKLDAFSRSVDHSVWRGPAADAFRDKIGELPPRLAKLHDSYAAASEAMSGYSRTLADLQSRAARLLGQAQAAHSDQVSQESQRTQATQQDPTASTAGYDQAIASARQRLSGVQGQIQHLREERTGAESTAVGKLHHAGDLGIHNDPWYKHAWDSVKDWVDHHVDLLKEISNVLKIVSAVAGLLSLIPFLAPVCGPLALITGGAALLVDALLCATGNGDWKALAVDAALMALPGAGRLLRGAVKALQLGSRGARLTQVAYGSTRLSKAAIKFRSIEGMTEGGNVAVVRYATGFGRTTVKAFRNVAPRGLHSEAVLMNFLKNKGISPDKVKEIYSELEPCRLGFARCKQKLLANFPNTKLSYSFGYDDAIEPINGPVATAARRAGVAAMNAALKGIFG